MNMFAIPLHGVNMTVKEDVIKAMKEAGKPMSAGEVEKATGIDRKEIDKAFKELKAEGAIVSPVRCKWEPAHRPAGFNATEPIFGWQVLGS